jgi:hypothetical protein
MNQEQVGPDHHGPAMRGAQARQINGDAAQDLELADSLGENRL